MSQLEAVFTSALIATALYFFIVVFSVETPRVFRAVITVIQTFIFVAGYNRGLVDFRLVDFN